MIEKEHKYLFAIGLCWLIGSSLISYLNYSAWKDLYYFELWIIILPWLVFTIPIIGGIVVFYWKLKPIKEMMKK